MSAAQQQPHEGDDEMAAHEQSTAHEDIDCRIRLTHDDFIMANHVVHGVSVLPGVTFLDLVHRVLIARGLDPVSFALRDILFSEPVVTCEGHERELRVTVTAGAPGRTRRITVESRWLRDGEPCAPWRENARAELVDCDEPLPPPLDVPRLQGALEQRRDMDSLYARTRREGIRHGGPMTCLGTLHRGGTELLASLRLDPTGAANEGGFHLHPAKADASTLVAFGQNEEVGEEPFVPFHIGWFRAPHAVRGTFHVHVAHPEVASWSGDLVHNDYTLHDDQGRMLAEFRDMSCKRIRHAGLITRLLDEVRAAPAQPVPEPVQQPVPEPVPRSAPEPARGDGSPAAAVAVATARLEELIAGELGRTSADVPSDTGFYDMGLDSVALLGIGERLETLVGATLYPTLLFEYGTVAALARHLADTYPHAFAAAPCAPAEPEEGGPGPAVGTGEAVTLCRVERWAEAP
ncbi:polyketide synthase dehydratase domain-containing protein, partial [Streptomyces parvus]|nr:hypothetical protein [Streptomyces parvus]